MKLLNRGIIKFFSKLVNLERSEILTWSDPKKLERKINNLCEIPKTDIKSMETNNKQQYKNCCKTKISSNGLPELMYCDCGTFKKRVA